MNEFKNTLQAASPVHHAKRDIARFSFSGGADVRITISLSELPFNSIERFVPEALPRYSGFLFYREPDDRYAFLACGKIFAPKNADEFLDSLHLFHCDGPNEPFEQPLLDVVPVVLFHNFFANVSSGDEWQDFSDNAAIPEIVLLQLNGQVYLFSYSIGGSVERLFPLTGEGYDTLGTAEETLADTAGTIGFSYNGISQWNDQVRQIKEQIQKGDIEKAVLSHRFQLPLPKIFSVSNVLRLFDLHPSAHRFIYASGDSLFIGASPEKLFSYRNGIISAEAIAGTAVRGNSAVEDQANATALLSSAKEQVEHKIVVDFLRTQLTAYSSNVNVPGEAEIKYMSRLMHLYTPVTAAGISEEYLGQVLRSLSPTPATCGMPKDKTRELIEKIEQYERGLYCGNIGWVSINKAVECFVPLRCALIRKQTAMLYSGCGIVAESDAESEMKEVIQKAKSILALFGNAR
jgi:menaquinone-specific isochorismate synthase